jgi:hypothetical protein
MLEESRKYRIYSSIERRENPLASEKPFEPLLMLLYISYTEQPDFCLIRLRFVQRLMCRYFEPLISQFPSK